MDFRRYKGWLHSTQKQSEISSVREILLFIYKFKTFSVGREAVEVPKMGVQVLLVHLSFTDVAVGAFPYLGLFDNHRWLRPGSAPSS